MVSDADEAWLKQCQPENFPVLSFESTQDFLWSFRDENTPLIHLITPHSKPVLSHLDWDLSNIILHPNLDAVASVIDRERAAFFPDVALSVHRMRHRWRGWETLFDEIEFQTLYEHGMAF